MCKSTRLVLAGNPHPCVRHYAIPFKSFLRHCSPSSILAVRLEKKQCTSHWKATLFGNAHLLDSGVSCSKVGCVAFSDLLWPLQAFKRSSAKTPCVFRPLTSSLPWCPSSEASLVRRRTSLFLRRCAISSSPSIRQKVRREISIGKFIKLLVCRSCSC